MGQAQDIRNRADDGVLGWQTKVLSRYAIAYVTAYESYQKVLKDQAEADKARADLIVSVASILGGSILMATMAQTSLRAIAGNALLNFVCNRNLDRTFNAMAVLQENKPFMFALGKLLDTVKERTTSAIKDNVEQIFATGPKIETSNPLAVYIRLVDVLNTQRLAINTAADMVERSPMTPVAKTRAFAELLAAPICRPPSQAVVETELAKKIELSFYLKAVLDSDRLVTFGPFIPGANLRDMREAPIPQAPSAPDYPRANMPRGLGGGTIIVAPELGGAVEARLRELHHEVFGRNFRADRPWIAWPGSPQPGDLGRAELRAAEHRLDDLAALVRPMALLQVRS